MTSCLYISIFVKEAARYNYFRSGTDIESVRGSTVTLASHRPAQVDVPQDELWAEDHGQGQGLPGPCPPFRQLSDRILSERKEILPFGGGGGGGVRVERNSTRY